MACLKVGDYAVGINSRWRYQILAITRDGARADVKVIDYSFGYSKAEQKYHNDIPTKNLIFIHRDAV